MKIKLFGKKIDPACIYCRYGKRNGEAEKVFCSKKGIVDIYFKCRKFDYDPLKRVPKKAELANDLSAEDFSL